jgi:hypothetical protein
MREIVYEETSEGHYERALSPYMKRKLKEEERIKRKSREEIITAIVGVVFFVAFVVGDYMLVSWALSR